MPTKENGQSKRKNQEFILKNLLRNRAFRFPIGTVTGSNPVAITRPLTCFSFIYSIPNPWTGKIRKSQKNV